MTQRKMLDLHKMCLIFLIMISFSIAASCAKTSTAPEELIGIWRTADIRYKKTFFAIEKKSITFQYTNGSSSSYAIKGIEKKSLKNNDWILYTLHYLDSNLQKMEFSFYYQSYEVGMIRFKHQTSLVWKKDA